MLYSDKCLNIYDDLHKMNDLKSVETLTGSVINSFLKALQNDKVHIFNV